MFAGQIGDEAKLPLLVRKGGGSAGAAFDLLVHALDENRHAEGDAPLKDSWRKPCYDPLHSDIHAWFVTVGSFGPAEVLDYTVIGRAVDLAARIESQAEGGNLLISSCTHSLVHYEVKTISHAELTLKGIPEPQMVWEAVG
jgi:class 3 adenylate cyclase